MKFLLIGAAALALTVVSPVAAKDLTPAKPKDAWAGGYIGAHVGYGQADRNGCGSIGFDFVGFNIVTPNDVTTCDGVDPDSTFDYGQQGEVYGVQAGYNWTLSEMLLVGLEGSLSATNMTGQLNNDGNGNPSYFGGVGNWDSIATATAKVGVTAGNFLVYGEGGVAYSHATFEGDLGCNFTMDHVGPVAGAGVSFKVNDVASIDLKYDHVWVGAANASCNMTDSIFNPKFVAVPANVLTQGTIDVVKVGLNFKIGGP